MQTELVKVREPFADEFALNASPSEAGAPEEWSELRAANLNSKSATSGIQKVDLGSAVPTTTASSNSVFKLSSNGPPQFKRSSRGGPTPASTTSGESGSAKGRGPAKESAPHQFLGKELVSLLDSSPLKEVTDFDPNSTSSRR